MIPVTLPPVIACRSDLERLIEAAIAALDALDGDPDLEPAMGAPEPKRPHGGEVGRLMADRANHMEHTSAELQRLPLLDQRHWAEGAALDETEDVSEDEGAQCEDEGAVEQDCDSEDSGSEWSASYNPKEQERRTALCAAAIEGLRAIQARQGQSPVPALRTLGGAICKA